MAPTSDECKVANNIISRICARGEVPHLINDHDERVMRASNARHACNIAHLTQLPSDLYYYIAKLKKQSIFIEILRSTSANQISTSFPGKLTAIPTELLFDLSTASKLPNSAYRVQRFPPLLSLSLYLSRTQQTR
jgi:hypothetical protein